MVRIRSILLLIVLILIPFTGFSNPTEEDRAAVNRRAAELIPFLPEQLAPSLPPISDRDFWDAKAALPSGRSVIQDAEGRLKAQIKDAPEELYKEYYRNGNRDNYQQVYGDWGNRLNVLGTAELLENKGRFLPAYEEMARFLCAYPSWCFPAHDDEACIYDGKIESVDIMSAYMTERLALYTRALSEVLPPDLVEEIEKNIRIRTLDPIRNYVENGTYNELLAWITSTNNWNPVCFSGVTCAALNTCESREERAWFLAAAEYFVTKYYFQGFTKDGCCTEGIGYWNYGFGKFTILAEHELRATGGKVNLYQIPLVKPVTEYVLKAEVAPDRYAAFADSPLGAYPSTHILAFLSKRLGLGYTEIEEKELVPNFGTGLELSLFPQDDLFPAVPVTGVKEPKPNELPRSYFPYSEILVCRTPQNDPAQFAAVFKGGNNGEHHNHNDLGTFCILRGGVWLVADPGAEIYTKRTFSGDRYQGELLNSYGHPVPRINGTLQAAGKNAAASVIETEFTDTADRFGLDLTSAYPDSGASRITRFFLYERKPAGTPNKLTVTDRVLFQPGTAETVDIPFVTYEKWEQIDGESFRLFHTKNNEETADPGIRIKITAQTADGTPISGKITTSQIGKDDPSVPVKPTRIAWEGAGPGNGSEITVITEICPE